MSYIFSASEAKSDLEIFKTWPWLKSNVDPEEVSSEDEAEIEVVGGVVVVAVGVGGVDCVAPGVAAESPC